MITLTRVASESGYVDPEAIKQAITPKTSLVAMTHASNVLGTVQPIEAIAAIVREAGALFLVDAAQSAGRGPDRPPRHADRPARVPGPQGALRADRHGRALRRPAHRRQRSVPGAKGEPAATRRARPSRLIFPIFSKGARPTCWASPGWPPASPGSPSAGRTPCSSHEVELLQRVVDWAEDSDGWQVAGRWDPETHVGALSLIVPEPLAPQDLGAILDTSFDIAVRPGLHCAPYIHRALGTFPDGTLRLSPGPFTTRDEIAAFVELRLPRSPRGSPELDGFVFTANSISRPTFKPAASREDGR